MKSSNNFFPNVVVLNSSRTQQSKHIQSLRGKRLMLFVFLLETWYNFLVILFVGFEVRFILQDKFSLILSRLA